jgi:NAD(P)-dependent dehydrogenase (short-subunit alcohol dehydrogenase family)
MPGFNKRTALFTAAGVGAASVAAGVGAGLAGWQLWRAFRNRNDVSLKGDVALITGGSRGLGLQLARDLAAQGCRVAICARDEAELERAREDLHKRGAEVWTRQCDVTDREQVEEFVASTISHFGRLDIVVANAGVIQVGPAESMTLADFEQAMNIMFWGVLHTIWAALPHMRERGSGRIVTITSIGGKISVPHLLPYSCAKFAAVALSEGLRSELAPHGIKVLTIVPGLMRTGSHLNAKFKGQQGREFAWFGLGASMPGASLSVSRASGQIVSAIRSGRTERILSIPAQVAARLHGAFPELSSMVLDWVNRVILPKSAGGSDHAVSGHEAQRKLNSKLHKAATTLGRRAANRMNEVEV